MKDNGEDGNKDNYNDKYKYNEKYKYNNKHKYRSVDSGKNTCCLPSRRSLASFISPACSSSLKLHLVILKLYAPQDNKETIKILKLYAQDNKETIKVLKRYAQDNKETIKVLKLYAQDNKKTIKVLKLYAPQDDKETIKMHKRR